jgi:23S rRNA pseudouridine1911/1915/1917 synthase
MACNETARTHLIDQLKKHTMKREYIAFAEGRAQTPKGTWRQWLDASRDGLKQYIVSEAQANGPGSTAKEGITHYEVLAEYRLKEPGVVVSKLRLTLETGRKHQIRVQAASAGLPLIGDRSYNAGYRPGSVRGQRIEFPRQALHAELLSLEHPDQPGQRKTWKAEWPADLRQLENSLRPFLA